MFYSSLDSLDDQSLFFSPAEFLNVDDDEVPEEDDDDIAGAEETDLQENTGWSSRTRCICFEFALYR